MKLLNVLLFILFFNLTFTAQTRQNEFSNFSAKSQIASDSVIQSWAAFYNGPVNDWDEALAITVDNSNNVYVTGGSSGSGSMNDFATIKYNSFGEEQWVARYNGPGNGNDEARAITVDNSGNVYVTGYSDGSGSYDYATVKYDASGNEVWAERFNGTANSDDGTTSVAVDNSGNVYVTGYSTSLTTDYDYVTIKYNSAGVEQWTAVYNGPGNWMDYACSVAVDDSGNVIVAGWSAGLSGFNDYATVKYDAGGSQKWVARYHGPWDEGDDVIYDLAVDCSGNVYVTGGSISENGDRDYLTIKYSPAGTEEWVARFNGVANDFDVALAVAVDCSGNVFVTGQSAGINSSLDYLTIKYNSSGVEEWTKLYNGPGNAEDGAAGIALDAAGDVYVSGISTGINSGFDYTIVKYNSSGTEQWVSRYNGTDNGDDWCTAMALDNLGDIYVTGYSYTLSYFFDYATVKYEQVIIPVELTSFTAMAVQDEVVLTWTTATEKNNRGFEIQKSEVGSQPDEVGVSPKGGRSDWESIGIVQGSGTTAEPRSYSFTDYNLKNGTYSYRLKQIDFNGSYRYSNTTDVTVNAPVQYSLSQNYPNPFNPSTEISFSLQADAKVTLNVYNVLGQKVSSLINNQMIAGEHNTKFDALQMPAGIYFYTLEAKGNDGSIFTSTKKMMLLK